MIKSITRSHLVFALLLSIIACNNRFVARSYTVYLPAHKLIDTISYSLIKEQLGIKDEDFLMKGNRTIILINDSTLNYFTDLGGIGTLTSMRYLLSNNFLYVDSNRIYNSSWGNSSWGNEDDILGHKFLFSEDSLVDITNNEKYFFDKHKDKNQPRTIISF